MVYLAYEKEILFRWFHEKIITDFEERISEEESSDSAPDADLVLIEEEEENGDVDESESEEEREAKKTK